MGLGVDMGLEGIRRRTGGGGRLEVESGDN